MQTGVSRERFMYFQNDSVWGIDDDWGVVRLDVTVSAVVEWRAAVYRKIVPGPQESQSSDGVVPGDDGHGQQTSTMAAEVTDNLSQQTVSDTVGQSQIRKRKRHESQTTDLTDIVGDKVEHEAGHAQQPVSDAAAPEISASSQPRKQKRLDCGEIALIMRSELDQIDPSLDHAQRYEARLRVLSH